MTVPDYVKYGQFPLEILICKPDGSGGVVDDMVEISEDECQCYNQLILFIVVNSYWYYVLSSPKVTDEEFDYIKHLIKEMEKNDTEEVLVPSMSDCANPNGYSPTRGNRCNHLSCRYNPAIQHLFAGMKENWTIIPWWKYLTVSGKEICIGESVKKKETEEERIRRERGTMLEFA